MAELLTNKTFHVELVSPKRIVVSEDAAMVLIPGEMGDFGILKGHISLSSALRPGVVSVHLPSGEIQKIFIARGFADVNKNLCSILAEDAINVNDLDRAEIENSLKVLHSDLDIAKDDAARHAHIQRQIFITEAKIVACTQPSSDIKAKNSVKAGADHT